MIHSLLEKVYSGITGSNTKKKWLDVVADHVRLEVRRKNREHVECKSTSLPYTGLRGTLLTCS